MKIRNYRVSWFIIPLVLLVAANSAAFLFSGDLLNLFVSGLLTYCIASGWRLMVEKEHTHEQ